MSSYNGSIGNTIEGNNIIENGELQDGGSYHWQFYNDQNDAVVEAKHNCRGAGMNNDTIDASIFDDEEGGESGKVEFYPFGNEPYVPPIPELPTFIIVLVGLIVLTGCARRW